MNKEKLDTFIGEVKQKGYQVNNHPIENEALIVSKDNYYHVMVDHRFIFEAPIDYIINDVEQEFERLYGKNENK